VVVPAATIAEPPGAGGPQVVANDDSSEEENLYTKDPNKLRAQLQMWQEKARDLEKLQVEMAPRGKPEGAFVNYTGRYALRRKERLHFTRRCRRNTRRAARTWTLLRDLSILRGTESGQKEILRPEG
jgi:hypothetical protein